MNLREFNDCIRKYVQNLPSQLSPIRFTQRQLVQIFNLNPQSVNDNFLLQNINMIECLRSISPDVFEYIDHDTYQPRSADDRHTSRDDCYDLSIGRLPSDLLSIHVVPPITAAAAQISTQSQISGILCMIKGNGESCQYCPHFLIEKNFCRFRNIPMLPEIPACDLFRNGR